jgi:hypothetical protein
MRGTGRNMLDFGPALTADKCALKESESASWEQLVLAAFSLNAPRTGSAGCMVW